MGRSQLPSDKGPGTPSFHGFANLKYDFHAHGLGARLGQLRVPPGASPLHGSAFYDARQVLSLAQEAKAKIADARQLAQQNTGNAASDVLAAAQALADIRSALADLENADNYGTSVTDEMAGTYSQYVTATSSDPTVTVLKPLAPGGKSVTVTADLPARTTEPALYSHSQVTQAEDGFDGAMAQLCESLSGSSSGNGDGGLLGGAASWQRAIVTQGVFNNAQNAYNDIQKVEKDLDNVKSASNPGAAIDSLNRLQSDLTPP